MMTDSYRQNLLNSLLEMKNMEMKLINLITDLAIVGEFKEIYDRFEVGDTLVFNVRDYENADDQNVQKLFPLLNLMYDTRSSLKNLNAISQEEIDNLEDDEDNDENDDHPPF